MKSVVIFNSQTGFTEQYAKWISEEIGCEAYNFKTAKKMDFSDCDTIIFGSWCHAGLIRKISWFKELMKKYTNKKYIVFAVGASPVGGPEIEETLNRNITEEFKALCKSFYCPGGLRYERMSFGNRLMMKVFSKMMAGKKDKSKDEEAMAEMICKDYDIQDRKYILPVIEAIRSTKLTTLQGR